jgi:hypothetical protein
VETEPGRLTPAGPGRFELHGELGFGDAARLLTEGERAFAAQQAVEWSLAAGDADRRLGYRNLPPAIVSLAGISDVAELIPAASGG